MNEEELLKQYYETHDEEGRLLSRHGQVEYITTMKYIHACAEQTGARKTLEIGAGTGRYSVPLAKEGFSVAAVELIGHNLDLLREKLDGGEDLTVLQGDATDLSRFSDDSFDMTLLLGPMYHLFTFEDQQKALSEAVRVTKPGGYILVAYCMNEPTVIQYVFRRENLRQVLENHMLTPEWHCVSEPKELFELVRVEDIAALDKTVSVVREKLVATDGATNYMREFIDAMDDFTFEKWVEYHLSVCERQDLIGASHHTLDVLKKRGPRTVSARIVPYERKYRDDLIFMVLEAKNALGRGPTLNDDLMDLDGYYFDRGDRFWIALNENDRVIGCVGCNLLSDDEAVLHRLYVKYSMKRQGIGSALLQTAEDFARENGRKTMKVHLGDRRTYFESRAFYPKHGYRFADEDHMEKKV